MKRVLVVGASSLIGFHLAAALRKRYLVFGTYSLNRPRIDGVPLFHLPLNRQTSLDRVIRAARPHFILYCAGEASEGKCQTDPLGTLFVNGEAASLFARACPHARVVFLSSSKVFSGDQGEYAEDAVTDGLSLYGKGKLQGEEFLSRFPNTISVRLGTVLGLAPFPFRSPMNRLLESLWNRTELKLVDDEFRSFYLVDELIPAFEAILHHPQVEFGPYHITGGEKDSHYSFARKVAQALRLTTAHLVPVHGSTFTPPTHGWAAPRGRDLSLRSKTFTDTFGCRLPRLEAALPRWAERLRIGTQ